MGVVGLNCRRILALGAVAWSLTGCGAPQGVTPARWVRAIAPGQQTIPDEVVVTLLAGAPAERDLVSVGPGTAVYKLTAGETVESAIAKLETRPSVTGAGPNIVFHAVSDLAAPSDPLFSRQWYLQTIGAAAAWKATKGSPITVAVLDSGIDAGHPDLAGRVVGGKNFVGFGASTDDDFSHGTHVAGAIGGLTNNAVGISGVASDVRLLPIKVLDANGQGSLDWVIAGINAAKASGARIINMSLSSKFSSSLEDAAIKAAVDAGIVVIVAAGNDNSDTPEFPAGSPGVLAIGASDMSDNRALFSNGGSHVRIIAPGVDIVSTIPRTMGSYGSKSGTSMATPIVSGVVAQMLSARPSLKPADVARILYETGKPTRGFNEARRIDFAAALKAVADLEAPAAPVAPIVPLAPVVAVPTPVPAPVVVAPTPAPVVVVPAPVVVAPTPKPAPVATPRPEGSTPTWGYVGLDGNPTSGTSPSTSQPPAEGLHSWGYVGFDGGTVNRPTPAAPGEETNEKPLRSWGYVPLTK